ncbi:ADP-ribosylglycohydrolase family protein [Halanaerobium praevalens]|uniref:ADP-ribosylation/Crystallin J1 n=1 Tax=Halanaerobium praevalens (strain ATCC 33744 / DSM 2228 / GSL) TaxID=572479 RepID=E3DLP8_HALPG|nr:ADP-ribosylglycohydrolase family protein [Halanaerobium praevalens]ADO77245.1 ADP-ribosylation/Crystallin J1 [Halanaerobium praevalens DSM 2228]
MNQTPSDNQELMQEIEKERKNKAFGSFFGLIIGDALGAAVEFKKRDSFPKLKDMRAGGPNALAAGFWTDDSSMALCLAESLSEKGYDLENQCHKYLKWYEEGYLSSTGECFSIGANTARSLEYFAENKELPPQRDRAAGNGSLMRLAPVPIYFKNDFEKAIDFSGKSSLTTHNNQMAVDSCRYFGGLLQQFINSRIQMKVFKQKVLKDTAADLNLDQRVIKAVEGAFNKKREDIKSDGFVINTLEASLWSFINSDSFEKAVLKAANLGGDSDTVAAVTGQLAGAYYGYNSIPEKWLNKLTKLEQIQKIAENLYQS